MSDASSHRTGVHAPTMSTTAEGTAVVLVTHDLDYARYIAHRLVRLEDGSLLPAD